MRMGGGGVLIVVAATMLGSVNSTRAADSQEEALIRQGIEHRRRQDDAAALPLFQRAYELHHSPRSAAQIGLDEIALGRWIDAERHLQEAVAASSDPWIRKNQVVLLQSLERVRSQLGSLEILGSPVGAEVVVEGEVRGTLPLARPIRARIGPCRVDIRSPGHTPITRTFEITPTALTRETINLAAEPAAPAPLVRLAPTSDVAAAGSGGSRPVARIRAQPAEPSDSASPSILSRWWFWTLVGAVAIGSGATAYALTRSTSNCPIGKCGGVAP
jgi:hypothetical protein